MGRFRNKTKVFINIGSNFIIRFLFFGRNSGLHGFQHLFRGNVNLLARFFWLLVLAVSTVGVYFLTVPLVENDGVIFFAPDTRYLEWTTAFPRLTVCEQLNLKDSQKTLVKLYRMVGYCRLSVRRDVALVKYMVRVLRGELHQPAVLAALRLRAPNDYLGARRRPSMLEVPNSDLVDPLSYNHRRFITGLLFGGGTYTQSLGAPCGELVPCDAPWRDIIENVHKNCEELVTDCAYNGVEFPCCETFLTADSEHGPCFTFNALEISEKTKNPLYTVNRTTGPGLVTFRVLSDADLSIHSNEELATHSLSAKHVFPLRILETTKFEILFSVVGIENDPAVVDENIADRKCRFVNEVPDEEIHTYSVYSNGACSLAVETKHMYDYCGCISPVRDHSYKKYYCNYTGMVCLAEYEMLKTKFGLVTADDDVDCFTSCVESELKIIHQTTDRIPDLVGSGIQVMVKMAGLPTLRYQRNLLRTNLDFVVSVGGMAGLFFGASLLSIVEIFYLILRKPNL